MLGGGWGARAPVCAQDEGHGDGRERLVLRDMGHPRTWGRRSLGLLLCAGPARAHGLGFGALSGDEERLHHPPACKWEADSQVRRTKMSCIT